MNSRNTKPLTALACAAAVVLLQALPAGAGLMVNFPFDEGTGKTTKDTVANALGWFGYQNPAFDQVTLQNNSPSGAAGDRSINITGRAFLLVDDSNGPVLNITNSPITLETWVYLDPNAIPKASEGLVGYGQSYKMGMKGGWQVFTLLGIKDITNNSAGVPAGQWTHLAAAWDPGVGVHFYINGVETFVANTTLSARPVQHNFLAIGSESPTNGLNCDCSMDRVRIHHALLNATQLDSDAANPKPALASTLVAYDFNEAAFPCQSAVAPSRPTILSTDFYVNTALPVWTNDTPTGLPSDHALAFNMGAVTAIKDRVNITSPTLPLTAVDGTANYTVEAWVKLPTTLINDREVLFRTYGPAPRIAVSIDIKRNLHTTVFGNADYSSSVVIPNDSRWHHLAVAMQGGTNLQFFLDGVLGTNMAVTAKAPVGDTSTGFLIGNEDGDIRYLRGLMDRVHVWDTPLSASQLDFPAIPGLAVVTTQPTNIVTDAGGTAQFLTAVSSASGATYQWFYKPYLESTTSVAVPSATGTTLTLNNVTADKQGFYFLRITNAVGVSESYGAQLAVRSGPQFDTQGFEAPKYVTEAFESQDLWTVDQNAGTYTVQTDSQIAQALSAMGLTPGQTVHSGSQAVLIGGPGGGAASVAVRPVLGFENQSNVTLDFWARPLTGGTTTLTTNNMFITLENSAGKRAAAVRFGPSLSIDYNSVNKWVATGLKWDNQTWYRFTLRLNYASSTYDVLVNGTKVNANPLPFYDATSDKFQQIRIYRGASQAGMILDDMTTSAPLRVSTPTVANGTVTISWQGGLGPYQLQRRASLATGQWENVGSPTSNTQATDTAAAGSMFYRVVGQ